MTGDTPTTGAGMQRSIRVFVIAIVAVLAMVFGALPAVADPPVMFTQDFAGSVVDHGEACGDPLAWTFEGTARVTRFLEDGGLVRLHAHVQESGTVTNLATGEAVELPRTSFVERVLLTEDGIIIEDVGLSVRVTGPDAILLDVGRFVVNISTLDLLQSAGQHPIREINPFSISDPALLQAFCGLFD